MEANVSSLGSSTGSIAIGSSIGNRGVIIGSAKGNVEIIGSVNHHHYNPTTPSQRTLTDPKDRFAALSWLSPLDYSNMQETYSSRASPKAGEWLLSSREFLEWEDGDCQKLWCIGKPGAGKTIIAAIIIRRLKSLQEQFKHGLEDIRIVYLYLTYKEHPTLNDLLGSIAKQLVNDQTPTPPALKKLWEGKLKKGKNDAPTLSELDDLLAQLVAGKKVFIIVDALDECETHLQKRLLDHLIRVHQNVKLLVTSRLIENLEQSSEGFQRLNVTAHGDDIRDYIDHIISDNWRLREFIKLDSRLEEDMKHEVNAKSQGIFLLARLHLDKLSSQITLDAVRQTLKVLPTEFKATYDDTMERIRAQNKEQRDAALATLSWIVFSLRPLSAIELQHAMAVIPGDKLFNEGRMPLIEDIAAFCCGLVIVDVGGATVRLVHYTAQNYFYDIKDEIFPSFESHIALICATYLSMSPLEQPDDIEKQMSFAEPDDQTGSNVNLVELHRTMREYQASSRQNDRDSSPNPRGRADEDNCSSGLSFRTKLHCYPFLKYAGKYLADHFRNVQIHSEPSRELDNIIRQISQLLSERPKRNFYCRLLYHFESYYCRSHLDSYGSDFDSDSDDGGQSESFWTSDCDDHEISSASDEDNGEISSRRPTSQRELSITPRLFPTSFHSQSPTDMSEAESESSSSPVMSDWISTAENLVPWAPGRHLITALEKSGQTEPPLCRSSSASSGSDSESESSEELNSETLVPYLEISGLHLAAFIGCPALATKFLDDGLDVNGRDIYNQTALVIALKKGFADVIKILLERGAIVDFKSKTGHALFLYAAQKDYQEIVETLMKIALPCRGDTLDGSTKLIIDLCNMPIFLTLAWLIVWSPAWFFLCTLSCIPKKGFHLLNRDLSQEELPEVSINFASQTLASAQEAQTTSVPTMFFQLLSAAYNGMEITEYTAQCDKSLPFTELFLKTAFFIAIERGHQHSVDILLKHGVDVNKTRDYLGRTGLHRATSRGFVPVIQLLLDNKADVEIRDNHQETAWSANANSGQAKVLELLTEAGANVNARGEWGVHRLYIAAAGGNAADVKFLLECGVNPSIRTDFGWAPLHWAAHNGKLDCVRLLMEYGADLSTISDKSTTPLDQARIGHQEDIADILVKAGAKTADEVYRERGGRRATYYED